jgi:hypothetical protein
VVTHPAAGPQKGRSPVDERSIDYGEVRGGDQDHPHACMNGWIYLGFTDDDGEERIEKLPCRRCAEEGK